MGWHAIQHWLAVVHVCCVCKVYGRKWGGRLLQYCEHTVLLGQECQCPCTSRMEGKGHCKNLRVGKWDCMDLRVINALLCILYNVDNLTLSLMTNTKVSFQSTLHTKYNEEQNS